MSLEDMMAKDAAHVADKADKSTLERLVSEYEVLTEEKFELDSQLEEINSKINDLVLKTIPDTMRQLGVEESKLNDGTKIKVKSKITASVPEQYQQKVFKWLIENGFGGILKTSVISSFDAGEAQKAIELAKLIKSKGFEADYEQKIHPMTFNSFVSEQVGKSKDSEGYVELPAEIKIFEVTKADIKFKNLNAKGK